MQRVALDRVCAGVPILVVLVRWKSEDPGGDAKQWCDWADVSTVSCHGHVLCIWIRLRECSAGRS